MKLAVVGSVKATEKERFDIEFGAVLEHLKPALVILTPNRRFNACIRLICEKKGVPVDEMTPPKPTWMGNCTIGERKQKCRDLRGYYVASRADAMVVLSERNAVGVAFQRMVTYMESAKKPVYHRIVF